MPEVTEEKPIADIFARHNGIYRTKGTELTYVLLDERSDNERVDDSSQRTRRHRDAHQNAGVSRRQVQMVYLPTYTRALYGSDIQWRRSVVK